MVCPSSELRAQSQERSGAEQRSAEEPALLWLAELTGAHIGLPPLPQDPEDRCSIWENLVSLVDFQCPGFPLSAEELCDFIHVPRSSSSSSSSRSGSAGALRGGAQPPPLPGDIDYRNNANLKPPYSYATLICMAMEASGKAKITLATICKWISDNFGYFRRADPTWQSSIRHNLCINKCFVKVPRQKGEPGRGAFWKLHPRYSELLKTTPLQTRRAPAELPQKTPPSPKNQPRSPGRKIQLSTELERLLQEFEEFGKSHKRSREDEDEEDEDDEERQRLRAKQLRGCGSAGAGEAPSELTELRGDTDWEALLSCLPDETLMATAFLEAGWSEESRESGPGCGDIERGDGDIAGTGHGTWGHGDIERGDGDITGAGHGTWGHGDIERGDGDITGAGGAVGWDTGTPLR